MTKKQNRSFKDVDDQAGHGKKPNQRMKHFLVLQYLLRETDEEHFAKTADIIDHLKTQGIYADPRSIYKDIEEINIAMVMQEDECTIEEAWNALQEDEDLITIANKHKKGFYVRRRPMDVRDVRLAAECVHAAKFISQRQSDNLIQDMAANLSVHQRNSINYDVHLVGRVKTNSKTIMDTIDTINEARNCKEKISFKYQKYVIQDIKKQVERRHGERYEVSPYALIINEGNYYLLAFDDKRQKIMTYRVDRMKDVKHVYEPREGAEEFAQIDMEGYAKRVFSMYGGKEERVDIQFITPLLDTAIERFGTTDTFYGVVDKDHFYVSTHVEVSDQFFGWLSGFGKRAKLTAPLSVVEQYKAYLDKIRNMYE